MNRSEVAKKAWKTRRRNAVPSAKQREVLNYLTKPRVFLAARLHESPYHTGVACYGVGFHVYNEGFGSQGPLPSFRPPTVTLLTFRALKDRNWIAFVTQCNNGMTTIHASDGTKTFYRSYNSVYQISDKGRKAAGV